MKCTSRNIPRAPILALALLLVCSMLAARTVTDMTITDHSRYPSVPGNLDSDPGTGVLRPNGADPAATRALIEHDIGNLRTTLSNFGVLGNPNSTPTFHGWEWPIRSGNNFLFSAGIWVGAEINGVKRVSTTVDGDNGTGEFWPEHIGTIPAGRYVGGSFADWYVTSKSFSTFNGKSYLMGAKGADDNGDWNPSTDDLAHTHAPSANYDAGNGYIGFDDDGDGLIDEDHVQQMPDGSWINVFGTQAGNDTTHGYDTDGSGDHNGDGNCSYDPDPHIDDDPAGDISHDRIDNNNNGLVDMDDPTYDGDLNVGFLDDNNNGADDEDGNARGEQEYYAAYHDDIDLAHVQAPDADGHVPLHVEILQRSYAFAEAYAQDYILVDYRIRNIGTLPLEHVYIALFSDPDIGAAGETGDNASAHDGNFYDTLNIRENEVVPMMEQGKYQFWRGAATPGVFGIEVVKTPIALGALKVTFANYNRLQGGDPPTDTEKYTIMSRGTPSDTSDHADDWRMMLSFGARATDGFTLEPDSVLPITVAFVSGANLQDVKANARSAYTIYLHDFQGPGAPQTPQFAVDAYTDHARIRWSNNSEASIDPFYNIPNFEGYTIERSTDQINWQTLVQYDLIDTLPDPFEWSNFNLGMPKDTLWLDSAHTHFQYYFNDNGLIPGHTYYYVVRAYSKGAAGAGILYTGRTGNIVGITVARNATTGAPTDLKHIYVFPNPYRGSHPGEEGGQVNAAKQLTEYPRKLFFMGLPANSASGACTIRIYSLAGDHLVTIHHDNGTEFEQWDLNTKNQQEIASGIYYFVVEYRPTGGKTDRYIDKFVVIK